MWESRSEHCPPSLLTPRPFTTPMGPGPQDPPQVIRCTPGSMPTPFQAKKELKSARVQDPRFQLLGAAESTWSASICFPTPQGGKGWGGLPARPTEKGSSPCDGRLLQPSSGLTPGHVPLSEAESSHGMEGSTKCQSTDRPHCITPPTQQPVKTRDFNSHKMQPGGQS